MLQAMYEGWHYLLAETAFANVAFGAVYSGFQDDPLGQCISAFRRVLEGLGTQLDYFAAWSPECTNWLKPDETLVPNLLVISGKGNKVPLSTMLAWVRLGSNLLVIAPSQVVLIDQTTEEEHRRFVSEISESIADELLLGQSVQHGNGRIWYICGDELNDLGVERGFCGEPAEDTRERKLQRIRAISQEITLFSVPSVDCRIRSIPERWSHDQPLVIDLELTQRSNFPIPAATVTIKPVECMEPLSSVVVEVAAFQPGAKRSIGTVVVPREKGLVLNPVSVQVTCSGRTRDVYLPDSTLEITQNLADLLRPSRPATVDLSIALPRFDSMLQPLATSSSLLQLLSLDPDAVVAKVRRIGEYLSKTIARKHLGSFNPSWPFATITKQLYDNKIINQKAKGHLETIRSFGNMAAHADDAELTSFSHDDAVALCYTLFLFLTEVTDANVL